MRQHIIGELSPSGVLDLGRRCPHSCQFCFYSFYDGNDDQFHYLRRAPWLETEKAKTVLKHFSDWGLSHFDYTGGEPSLHPDIVEITRYAHQELGLKGRMITLAQFLNNKPRKITRPLLDELLDAGLNDFLFSFHSIDKALFKQMTGGDLDKMLGIMDELDRKDFSYCVNSVVNQYNYQTLPDTAKHWVNRNIRIANFIMMRMDWGLREQPGVAINHKGNYENVTQYVKEAIDILDGAGIAVNVRYAPYCTFKGYEKHLVGYKGIQLDPYEWRNGTLAASEGTPWLKSKTVEDYYRDRVPVFENDPVYNLVFADKCQNCALRAICDGVDLNYIKTYGWEEFQPYAGEKVRDIVYFRYGYSAPFLMKEEQYEHHERGGNHQESATHTKTMPGTPVCVGE